MTRLEIIRVDTSTRGCGGVLLANGKFVCMTLELPWRSNIVNESCIPSGQYDVMPYMSKRFGNAYMIKDVPGRSGILFHKGNTLVDTTGCILLGAQLTDSLTLINSAAGYRVFEKSLEGQILLEIRY